MAKGFRYEFSIKDIFYFLFKKKKCPKCNGKLSKCKYAEIVDGKKFNTSSVPLYIKGREIKSYYYSFTCRNCGAEYTLSELTNEERI